MLRDALDAFVEGDVARASLIRRRDDAVDALYGEILRVMTTYMGEHPEEILPGLRVIKVAKYIERIADHATNIAEEVIFMVQGDDVRHMTDAPVPPATASSKVIKSS